ncbi:MAG: RNA polymerase sigma factor [Actinobacteria bacterium]|nr:RNA polymerase sigma factor [Actinomycetota bacterium]
MEASVLKEPGSSASALVRDPRAAFLRLQSDERLVTLTRRGNEAAYETLIARYRARLLAFCRHMVGSTEDAEDILQEVFVSAYRAMLADDRVLNVRPWLYRIARNRSLNHLRRPRPTGVDSMDIFEGGAAVATADRVHDKLDLEDLVDDVKRLPETQRTALMLREMGDLSYDQIAEAMDTSVPSVKSLLVRARVSLAEAAESRRLSCDEVRLELGAVAEGLQKMSAPVRRHVGDCDRCRAFKKDLTVTNRKLAVLAPVGGLLAIKNLLALKIFGGAGAGASGGFGAATGAGGASGAAGVAGAGAAAGGVGAGAAAGISAGLGTIAVKVGAGLATAAIVTGGVAQVAKHELNTGKIAQKPAVTQRAESTDSAASGGVAPKAPVVAVPVKPIDQDANPDKEMPADETTPVADKPSDPKDTDAAGDQPAASVIDEETTTVVITPGNPAAGPTGGPTVEGPGMPAPEPSAPVASPPASPPSGATGASSGVGPTGGGADEESPGMVGAGG